MGKDPYSVLGISSDATDAEVKKAYRNLAKKYHPDNFTDSPLKGQAEEKMKEINSAYEAIQNIRSGKSDYNSYTSDDSFRNTGMGIYRTVREYINARRYSDADALLETVSIHARGAEWHFLKGLIFYTRGWYYDAESSIRTACEMDPTNQEYRQVLQMLTSRARTARSPYTTSTSVNECSICDICTTLACANCLCNCFGGGC